MQFEFSTANRIIFGAGARLKIGQVAKELGSRALVISGIPGKATQELVEILDRASVGTTLYSINGEPTVETIQQGVIVARQYKIDLVIGLGGGSALDCAKAVAVMLTNPGDLTDYLETIGQGLSLNKPPIPVILFPTTAGTGSEVTRNAVIGAPEFGIKVSLRSPLMLPRLAMIDPELTYNLPAELTASTGMDALTQLIEPFVCNNPNPITDGLCREGMSHSTRALLRAYQDGHDVEARHDLCIASLFGGMALANARLGAVHGFAGVLGGMVLIPHGILCARLLPIVMEVNLRALNKRLPDSSFLDRYRQVACILTSNPKSQASDGVQWVLEHCASMNIQPLGGFGLDRTEFPEIIGKASQASSMKGNPIALTYDELLEILERAI